MAIWIEIRCEGRGEGRWKNPCLSDKGSGPMDMAGDTQESVIGVLRYLTGVAKESGWERRKDGWVCPACIEHESGEK